ncbi:MAG: hypothetical protein JKY54_03035 [Flavobacteriales bacterium]|nr:hypothetical protein [Flavobacteriales bacterium]
MKIAFILLTTLVGSISISQQPVFIDTSVDSTEIAESKRQIAIGRLKNKRFKDSIEYYKALEQSKPTLTSPQIEFRAQFKTDGVHVKIMRDDSVCVDSTLGVGLVVFGPFESEHFYNITCSKEDYVDKRIFISTIGAKDSMPVTNIEFTATMIEASKFKGLRKSNPFDKPVAKVIPNVEGLLNFDIE